MKRPLIMTILSISMLMLTSYTPTEGQQPSTKNDTIPAVENPVQVNPVIQENKIENKVSGSFVERAETDMEMKRLIREKIQNDTIK